MGKGSAPTRLRRVSPLLHMTTLTTGMQTYHVDTSHSIRNLRSLGP